MNIITYGIEHSKRALADFIDLFKSVTSLDYRVAKIEEQREKERIKKGGLTPEREEYYSQKIQQEMKDKNLVDNLDPSMVIPDVSEVLDGSTKTFKNMLIGAGLILFFIALIK